MAGVRYLDSAGHHLACEVLDGPRDEELVLITPGGTIPYDLLPRDRIGARLLRGLATVGRLVVFDRRGIGASDPIVDWSVPLAEQWADDLAAVVAGACSKPPIVVSLGDYWGPARLFAGAHPDELKALVLYEPTGPESDRLSGQVDTDPAIDAAGSDWLRRVCPSRADDTSFREWFDRAGRTGAAPAVARRIYHRPAPDLVARLVAAQRRITRPTLVLRRPASPLGAPRGPDPVTDGIPGARRVDLPGADYHWLGEDVDALLAEISHFVTGARFVPPTERFLAAVVFTDLVDSTGRAVTHGDARWRILLDRHDTVMRDVVEGGAGHIVKDTGDGVLATFASAHAALVAADAARNRLRDEGLPVRVGIHVGDIERRGDDVAGIGVHIAARVMAAAGPGEIFVTQAVALAVHGAPWSFDVVETVELKGVPGRWQLLNARPGDRGAEI